VGYDGDMTSDRGAAQGGDAGASRQLESTADLLSLVRAGNAAARERLLGRYLPILRRWAHGRLPAYARDLAETDDLVQITLVRALDHLEAFEPRREGAFLAYLRSILLNSLRDEIRRVKRRPVQETLTEETTEATRVAETVGIETLMAYEAALATLPESQQEAVILRVEFGFSYDEVAGAIGSPSANAARMTVTRALERLAEVMES